MDEKNFFIMFGLNDALFLHSSLAKLENEGLPLVFQALEQEIRFN